MAALKHEVPALLATAIVNENSFAELLDRRLAKMKLIEAQPASGGDAQQIETKPPLAHTNNAKLVDAKENGGNADARLPPTIPDRRYRRF